MNLEKTLRAGRRGFTLVEVALALLVVSVGILAAFALIPAGLQTNQQAIDDTQAAMFADTVFEGLRAQAKVVPWAQVGTAGMPIPAIGAASSLPAARKPYSASSSATITVTATPITYVAKRAVGTGEANEVALRYTLGVNEPVPNVIKSVSLVVWPGEFASTGAANSNNVYRFYTELLNLNP